ncbi:hypothetical protein [uncultured Williamsia sp.]|uniref:hypothetical protein n=1 Tax=uncultured Williamsia sp. TaxID=259311 RepID=UPI00261C4EBE|nr:hypothetical protein [uncultured Williamsia sp.]
MRSTDPATFAAPLHALGLLTDDDLAAVDHHLDIANRARAFAANAAVLRRDSVLDATDDVMKSKDVEKAILSAAGKVQTDAAADVAAQVAIAADTRADEIVRKHRDHYAAAITAEFEAMTQEAVEPLQELAGISTPAQAIEHGVADAWKRLTDIKERWGVLDDLVVMLRLAGLIASARNGDHGWHWAWRQGPVDSYAMQRARNGDPSGVVAFALDLTRGRYVPQDADEASRVLDAYESSTTGNAA